MFEDSSRQGKGFVFNVSSWFCSHPYDFEDEHWVGVKYNTSNSIHRNRSCALFLSKSQRMQQFKRSPCKKWICEIIVESFRFKITLIVKKQEWWRHVGQPKWRGWFANVSELLKLLFFLQSWPWYQSQPLGFSQELGFRSIMFDAIFPGPASKKRSASDGFLDSPSFRWRPFEEKIPDIKERIDMAVFPALQVSSGVGDRKKTARGYKGMLFGGF